MFENTSFIIFQKKMSRTNKFYYYFEVYLDGKEKKFIPDDEFYKIIEEDLSVKTLFYSKWERDFSYYYMNPKAGTLFKLQDNMKQDKIVNEEIQKLKIESERLTTYKSLHKNEDNICQIAEKINENLFNLGQKRT